MLKGPLSGTSFPCLWLSLRSPSPLFALGRPSSSSRASCSGVSSDLGVSIPMAGLLVTGYAAGVAVGGPVLALLTARVPIRPAALGVMAIFALGQVFCALAPNYELLLLARLVSACGHGVFFGVATIAVSQLVPIERRGSAARADGGRHHRRQHSRPAGGHRHRQRLRLARDLRR